MLNINHKMFTITILSKSCLLKHEFGVIIKKKQFGYQQCLYSLPERHGSESITFPLV